MERESDISKMNKEKKAMLVQIVRYLKRSKCKKKMEYAVDSWIKFCEECLTEEDTEYFDKQIEACFVDCLEKV